jgi:hypothetical protein
LLRYLPLPDPLSLPQRKVAEEEEDEEEEEDSGFKQKGRIFIQPF